MGVDLGISLFTSAGILFFLSLLAVTLRCITRIYIVKAFGLDDLLMIVAMAFYAHYCAWVFFGRSSDQGRPDNEIPLSDVTPALQAFYFAENSYLVVACFVKLSIGTFCLRIVKTKSQQWMLYGVLGLVSVYTFIMLTMSIFQCKPVDHFWHLGSPGTCLRPGIVLGMTYTHSGIIASSDFFFAILPMFVVWHLQMSQRMKLSVTLLMAFGALAGITTIARIPYIKAIASKTNFLHDTAVEAIITSIEPGLGIILGSAAATRPLFGLLFDKTRTYASSKTASRNRNRSLGSSNHTGSRSRRSQMNPDGEECIRLHSYGSNGKEFGTVMIVEGGRRLCRKCADIEDQKICHKCGAPTNLSESQEDLTRVQTPGSGNHVIYKDVTVKRVVEFLTKD